MDARIVVEAAEMNLTAASQVTVTTVIKVEDLVLRLQSLCEPAAILAPLLSLNGTSVSAVAPDFISRGGVSPSAALAV